MGRPAFFLSHDATIPAMRCVSILLDTTTSYEANAHDAYASTVTVFVRLFSPQVDFRNFPPCAAARRNITNNVLFFTSYIDVNEILSIVKIFANN